MRATLAAVLLAAALVGGYHAFVGRHAASSDELAALRVEVEALREAAPSSAPVLRRLIDFEVRLEALEQGASRGETRWTDRDLEALRAMLNELKRRARAEQTVVNVRQRLANAGIEMTADEERIVLPLISDYTGNLLAVRDPDLAHLGPAERFAGAIEAHARMTAELRALLPAERAQQFLDLFPPPPTPAAPETPRDDD
ncbi:MAG: hypothetical protein ACYTG6_07835 [Planctomycetota bacterium]|jgi:hypothetical protein